jgi:DNA repair photolyase
MYYQGMLGVTSQFIDCGNCFRLDSYKGCSFGCSYCFSNNRSGGYRHDFRMASPSRLSKWLIEAFEDGLMNLRSEMFRSRVPIHFGGMSDPFCLFEWSYGVSKSLLEVLSSYDYPVNISTKFGGVLPSSYWSILNPKFHTFSISLMGLSEDYIRSYELNTPSVSERLSFIRELKNRGFWVGIRIQPIIDIEECCSLVRYLCNESLVDFITLEHLKLMQTNGKMCREFFDKLDGILPFVQVYNEYRVRDDVRTSNIERIKSISTVPVGVGDDNLHHLSDTLNCCGMDVMPESFKGWHKYNTMYLNKTKDFDVWSPSCDCNRCFFPSKQKEGCVTMRDYVNASLNKEEKRCIELSLFD